MAHGQLSWHPYCCLRGAETVQQAVHGAQPHCWMQRLAHRISSNPARFFAILAGVSFVVLLATLIAQVTMTLVCEVCLSLHLYTFHECTLPCQGNMHEPTLPPCKSPLVTCRQTVFSKQNLHYNYRTLRYSAYTTEWGF